MMELNTLFYFQWSFFLIENFLLIRSAIDCLALPTEMDTFEYT